jgi:hypothetical protein
VLSGMGRDDERATTGRLIVGSSLKGAMVSSVTYLDGIVRANSFTLPKRQNRISWPLIFLHFSGSI